MSISQRAKTDSMDSSSAKQGAEAAPGITRRVASNFGWILLSESIGKGTFFISNIYLARVLGVSNYGLFTLALSITFYFWLAVDLGTSMYGIREISRNKENPEKIINPILTLRITSGLVVFTVYMVSLSFLEIPEIKKHVFIGCGLYLLTYSFYTDWIFRGLEKIYYTTLGSIVFSVIFLSGIVILVNSSKDVVLVSYLWSGSYFFGSIALIYVLYYSRKLNGCIAISSSSAPWYLFYNI